MNYRHIYHAGNFADVFKHIALVEILSYYKKKDKPFFVLDAFAGIGKYSINDERALKTEEMQDGIFKLLSSRDEYKRNFLNYFSLVKKYIDQDLYPGSPLIIRDSLRPQDRLICCELHPEDFMELKELIPSAHKIDAYNAIKAFLPPEEKRGIIFLDPPFEKADEFDKLLLAIKEIHTKFRNGTIFIWYPIKNQIEVQSFYKNIKHNHSGEYIISELILPSMDKLHKTGILVINPTWGLENYLKGVVENLNKIFI